MSYFETTICGKNNWKFNGLCCLFAWIFMSLYNALANHNP